MKSFLVAFLSVLLLLGCARYKDSVMAPWVGAPEDELVAAWGYPSAANDIVTINDQTKVYTYRYVTTGPDGSPSSCRVSFTLTAGVVARWEYNGSGCPRNRRSPGPTG